MRRVLVGIFAHPDDEAFGPSATLMREVDAGTDLHLICVTCGEHGVGSDATNDLATVRTKEWQTSAAYMGAVSTYSLGYTDGGLCNMHYQQLVDDIHATLVTICSRYTEPVELYLMTYDPNGLSGHLDHIAVTSVVTFVFYKLKREPIAGATVRELAYYCLSLTQKPMADEAYFVYSPPGRPADFIDRSVPTDGYLERKFAAMRLHHSQLHDAEAIMALGKTFHAVDNFHILT